MPSVSSQPSLSPCRPARSPACRIPGTSVLAADIGGTHARLGLIGSTPDQPLLAYHAYPCAGYADLRQIVRAFLDQYASGPVTHGVLACPGRVLVEECRSEEHTSELQSR